MRKTLADLARLRALRVTESAWAAPIRSTVAGRTSAAMTLLMGSLPCWGQIRDPSVVGGVTTSDRREDTRAGWGPRLGAQSSLGQALNQVDFATAPRTTRQGTRSLGASIASKRDQNGTLG